MKYFMIILVLMLSLFGCDPTQDIIIENTTGEKIFVSFAFDGKFTENPLKLSESRDTLWNETEFVPQNEIGKFGIIGHSGWEDLIKDKSADNTIIIFIFTANLLKHTDRDALVHDQIYSKRYKLSVSDLNDINWRIKY